MSAEHGDLNKIGYKEAEKIVKDVDSRINNILVHESDYGDYFVTHDPRYGGISSEGMERAIHIIAMDGHWEPEFGNNVVELVDRYGTIYAERYVEGMELALDNPDFDHQTYSDLVMKAFQRMGKIAGSGFTRNYARVVSSGMEPSDYFNFVDGAIDMGGKRFAESLAHRLPSYLEVGGESRLLRSLGAHLKKVGSIQIADRFMKLSPEIIKHDIGEMEGLSDLIEKEIKYYQKDKDVVLWALPGIVKQHIGHNVEYTQVFNDLREQYEQSPKNRKVAKWYGYGLSRLSDGVDAAEYKRLFNELRVAGSGAIVFFTKLASKDNLYQFHDTLLTFRNTVSNKVFSKTLWFGRWLEMDKILMMRRMMEIYGRENGENWALATMDYTLGVRRNKGYVDDLVVPAELKPKQPRISAEELLLRKIYDSVSPEERLLRNIFGVTEADGEESKKEDENYLDDIDDDRSFY